MAKHLIALAICSQLSCHAGEISVVGDVANPTAKTQSKFRDPVDGYFDLSQILNDPLGFVPLVIPITEPALGSGAAIAPIFIDKPEGRGRPNITGLGVMKTSNDSEGLFGMFSRYYFDQRLHLTGGFADMSLNLDFNGLGSLRPPGGSTIQYNLEMQGGLLGGDWKFNDSNWRAGFRYARADIDLSFDRLSPPDEKTLLGNFGTNYVVSSVSPSIIYDSRDNIFTPTSGLLSELSLTANMEALGGTSNFQILNWTTTWFRPLKEDTLFLGVKGQVEQSFGDLPFYMQPYVKLRGAPAARFQGEGVASLEAELRWQFHPRWSALAFAGTGMSWSDRVLAHDSDPTATGGVGFRYLLAREHGLHMGIDLAYGEEGSAVYVQFGSAWMRF